MKSELEEMRQRQILRYADIIFTILQAENIRQANVDYYALLHKRVTDHYAKQNRLLSDNTAAEQVRQAIAILATLCLEDGTILAHLTPQELSEQLESILNRLLAVIN